MIVQLNDETFNEFIEKSKKMVLVKFGASWCMPCRQQKHVFSAAASITDAIVFAEVDIDDAYKLTEKFSIKSVPTTILFDMGKVIAQWNRTFTSKDDLLKTVLGE